MLRFWSSGSCKSGASSGSGVQVVSLDREHAWNIRRGKGSNIDV